MARIAYASREDLPPALHPLVDDAASYGPFASLVGALGRRPPILEHTFGLLTDLRREAVLPRRYLELALVAVSQRNACDYCVAHHGPMLTVEGMSAAGVASLLDDPENHPELDDVDRLVVDYAVRVNDRAGSIRDGIFERLKAHFSEEQVVELTWRIALCGAFNRFNDALQLDLEPEAQAILDAA